MKFSLKLNFDTKNDISLYFDGISFSLDKIAPYMNYIIDNNSTLKNLDFKFPEEDIYSEDILDDLSNNLNDNKDALNNELKKWCITGFKSDNEDVKSYIYKIIGFTSDEDVIFKLLLDETYTLDDYVTNNGLLDNTKFKLKLENGINMLTVDFYTDNKSLNNYATYLSNKEEAENAKMQGKNEAFTKALSIVDYPSNKIGILKDSIKTELNILLNSNFSIENTETTNTIKDLLTDNIDIDIDIELCIKPTSFYYVDEDDKEYKYDLKKEEIYEEYPIYRLFDAETPSDEDDYIYFKINSKNDEKFLKEMFDYIDNNEDFKNNLPEGYIFLERYDATFYINTKVTTAMENAISNYYNPSETVEEDDIGDIDGIEQNEDDDGIKLINGTYEFTWNTEGIDNKTFSDPYFSNGEKLIKNGTFEVTVKFDEEINNHVLQFAGIDEYGYDYEWNDENKSYELKSEEIPAYSDEYGDYEATPAELFDYIIINSNNELIDSSNNKATFVMTIIDNTDNIKLENGTYTFMWNNSDNTINPTFSENYKEGQFNATVSNNTLKFNVSDEYDNDYEWNDDNKRYEAKTEENTEMPSELFDYIIIKSDNTALDISYNTATYESSGSDSTKEEVVDDSTKDEVVDDSTQDEVVDDSTQDEVVDDSTKDEVVDDSTQDEVVDDNKLQNGTYTFRFKNNNFDTNIDIGESGDIINYFLRTIYYNVTVSNDKITNDKITINNVNNTGLTYEFIYNDTKNNTSKYLITEMVIFGLKV